MPLLSGIPMGSGTPNSTTPITVSTGQMNVQPIPAVSTTTADRDRFLTGGTSTVNLPPSTVTSTGPTETASTGGGGALQLPQGNQDLQDATHPNSIASLPNVTPSEAFLEAAAATSILGVTPRQTAALIKPSQYSQDQLSVADYEVKNGQFRQIAKNGIASFRPEILSSIDFLPLVEKARVLSIGGEERLETTPAGDFFDIQYRGSMLRQETLVRFIRTIERASARRVGNVQIKQELSSIREAYEKMLREVERSVKFYSDAVDSMDFIKNTINIKTIPSNLYNTKEFLALDRFFEKKMQYSLDKYAIFSDTKILSQLLFDFRSMLEAYSVSLLNLTDTDRINDFNPVVIDKTYTISDQFSFNIASLRSENSAGINASETQFFTSFISSLPDNPDDRIKILSLLLSKEFRISKGLGKPNNKKTLQDVYGTTDQGNPFDNIVGGIGGTIFEPVTGDNSLASVLHLDLPGDSQVLPFESKYVDTDNQGTVYVPGSAYFIDSIINVSNIQKPEFNSNPFVGFVNDYNNRLLSARNVIEDLLELNNPQSPLRAVRFSDSLMTSVKTAIAGLKDPRAINTDQAVLVALFKLANTDNELKNMLFQFSMLLGMGANGTAGEKTIFKSLATELVQLRSLSAVRVPTGYNPNMYNGLAELRTYLETLANDIENKVYALTVRALAPANPGGPFGSPRSTFSAMTTQSPIESGRVGGELRAISSETANGIHTLQVQRGSIARTLMAAASTKQDWTTNLMQEFISLVDTINTSAQVQGLSNYLLPDKSSRTRLNFISASTQMLMFFEILSAYAKKYAFASFESSLGHMTATIKVDVIGNSMCFAYLNELTTHTTPQLTAVNTNQTFQTTAPAGSTATSYTLPSAGNQPQLTAGFLPFSMIQIAPGGNTTAAPRQETSVNLLNQASTEIASALQDSTAFNGLLSTNPAEASSLLMIAGIGGITLLLSSRFTTLRTSLSAIRSKLGDEDQTVSNVLHILNVIGTYLKQGSNKVQGFFNQQTLATFLSENSITDLQLLQNPSQVRMASYILDLVKEKIPASTKSEDIGTVNSNVIISDIITPEEHNALLSYLSQGKFLPESRADKKIKILTVGIPANFSQHLADRIHIRDINERTFRDKQFDVVSFNVYKRDARFDNIVFKPQKVLFDLSMFQKEAEIVNMNVQPLEEFRRALLRASTTDYQNILTKRTLTPSSIGEDPKYAFLSSEEREALVTNQVTSYLLGTYINILTGMRLYEDEFLATPYVQGTFTDSRITTLVFNYLKTIENIRINDKATIEELLTDPNINADAKDLLRLVTYGSFVFEPEYIRASVLRPKLFDRIVHIPLDIEGFEIDEESTTSTESGKLTWRSAYFQEQIQRVDNKLYLKQRLEGDLIMEDYFVTIEAL
jgi:hypothetical protein